MSSIVTSHTSPRTEASVEKGLAMRGAASPGKPDCQTRSTSAKKRTRVPAARAYRVGDNESRLSDAAVAKEDNTNGPGGIADASRSCRLHHELDLNEVKEGAETRYETKSSAAGCVPGVRCAAREEAGREVRELPSQRSMAAAQVVRFASTSTVEGVGTLPR